MNFYKKIIAYYLYIIRYISLITSILYMLSPLLFISFYVTSQQDYNFMVRMYEGGYPWNLITSPVQYFSRGGLLFFVGLAEYFLSYIINQFVDFLK